MIPYYCSITQPLRGRDKASSGVLAFVRRQEMMSWPTVSAILLLVFTRSGTQFDAVGPERSFSEPDRNECRDEYRLAPGSYIALEV